MYKYQYISLLYNNTIIGQFLITTIEITYYIFYIDIFYYYIKYNNVLISEY